MGHRHATGFAAVLVALVTSCGGSHSDITGRYHIDVERTSLALPIQDRTAFKDANRSNDTIYEIAANGTWTAQVRVTGKLYVRRGTWRWAETRFVFQPTMMNGKAVESGPVAVTCEDDYLVWNELGKKLYLKLGNPPKIAAANPPLPGADKDSDIKIADFLADCAEVDRGDARFSALFEKYGNRRIRWAGQVRGQGGQDVRIQVGAIDVELPTSAVGKKGLVPGTVVQFEGKITSINLSPWIYLRDAKVLSVAAAPGK